MTGGLSEPPGAAASPPRDEAAGRGPAETDGKPILRLDKVTIQFGGLTAVSELDLEIPAKGLSGVIGPNGAGKTTVFNLITGVYAPTHGTITFEGRTLNGLRPSAIARRGITRTFQIGRASCRERV